MNRYVSYIAILVATYIFTYIFEVNENYTFLYMLLMVPVFDFISIVYFKKSLDANINISKLVIKKNEEIELKIDYANSGRLPVAFVKSNIELNKKVSFVDSIKDSISLSKGEKLSMRYSLYGLHIGIGEVEIPEIEVTSIFGLFTKKIKKDYKASIVIEPKCIDIDGFLDLVNDTILDEDEIEANSIYVGDPGYEYKRYSDGDPLNRLNWKLYSKTNTLMIRKSVEMEKSKKTIILDSYMIEEHDYEEICDILIEGLIGIANELYLKGYDVEIIMNIDNCWKELEIINENDMSKLQRSFSTYSFIKKKERFKDLELTFDKKSDYIIFTNNKDKELKVLTEDIIAYESSVNIVTTNKSKILDNEFYLNNSYGIERF